MALCVWLLSLKPNVFKVHPRCNMFQCFIHFYGRIIFHLVDRPQFVYLFIGSWTLGSFPPFGCCE